MAKKSGGARNPKHTGVKKSTVIGQMPKSGPMQAKTPSTKHVKTMKRGHVA